MRTYDREGDEIMMAGIGDDEDRRGLDAAELAELAAIDQTQIDDDDAEFLTMAELAELAAIDDDDDGTLSLAELAAIVDG